MKGNPDMVHSENGSFFLCKSHPGGRVTKEMGFEKVPLLLGKQQEHGIKRQCLSCGNVVHVGKDCVVGLKRCGVCGVVAVPV